MSADVVCGLNRLEQHCSLKRGSGEPKTKKPLLEQKRRWA